MTQMPEGWYDADQQGMDTHFYEGMTHTPRVGLFFTNQNLKSQLLVLRQCMSNRCTANCLFIPYLIGPFQKVPQSYGFENP